MIQFMWHALQNPAVIFHQLHRANMALISCNCLRKEPTVKICGREKSQLPRQQAEESLESLESLEPLEPLEPLPVRLS